METTYVTTLNGQPLADVQLIPPAAPDPEALRNAHEQIEAQQAQLDAAGTTVAQVTGQLSAARATVERLERELQAVNQTLHVASQNQERQAAEADRLHQTYTEHLAAARTEITRLEGCYAHAAHELAESQKVLTIKAISAVNLARSQRWHPGGIQEWSVSDWFAATGGEAGELGDAYLALKTVSSFARIGNSVKKLNRERDGIAGNSKSVEDLRQDLADEMADAFLYLILMALRAEIDLQAAIIQKFNKTSERVGFPERL